MLRFSLCVVVCFAVLAAANPEQQAGKVEKPNPCEGITALKQICVGDKAVACGMGKIVHGTDKILHGVKKGMTKLAMNPDTAVLDCKKYHKFCGGKKQKTCHTEGEDQQLAVCGKDFTVSFKECKDYQGTCTESAEGDDFCASTCTKDGPKAFCSEDKKKLFDCDGERATGVVECEHGCAFFSKSQGAPRCRTECMDIRLDLKAQKKNHEEEIAKRNKISKTGAYAEGTKKYHEEPLDLINKQLSGSAGVTCRGNDVLKCPESWDKQEDVQECAAGRTCQQDGKHGFVCK